MPPIPKGLIPVFWACGVTPQAAALEAKIDLMITHSPRSFFRGVSTPAFVWVLPAAAMISWSTLASVQRLHRLRVAQCLHEGSGNRKRCLIAAETLQRRYTFVSRERVYQLTALVTKLPPQIKDFLAGTEDPAVLRFFTERRLRPLTMIPEGKVQMAQFAELLAMAGEVVRCSR